MRRAHARCDADRHAVDGGEKLWHAAIVSALTMCRATALLCQPGASRHSVDCIELAVLHLYNCEDAIGVTSCYYLLVQLELLSFFLLLDGWPPLPESLPVGWR
jgi:hypothetical protein